MKVREINRQDAKDAKSAEVLWVDICAWCHAEVPGCPRTRDKASSAALVPLPITGPLGRWRLGGSPSPRTPWQQSALGRRILRYCGHEPTRHPEPSATACNVGRRRADVRRGDLAVDCVCRGGGAACPRRPDPSRARCRMRPGHADIRGSARTRSASMPSISHRG